MGCIIEWKQTLFLFLNESDFSFKILKHETI